MLELDERLTRIREFQNTCARRVMPELVEIERRQLWKQRIGADGKIMYRTISQWAAKELGMTRRYMLQLLQVAARFDEQTIDKIGFTKCRVILQLTPKAQKGALQAAMKGASKRALERIHSDEVAVRKHARRRNRSAIEIFGDIEGLMRQLPDNLLLNVPERAMAILKERNVKSAA